MSVVIRVENVSKKYQLGTIGTQSLKGDFTRWLARMQGKEDPFSKIGDESQHQNGEFWALKNINFEVKQGDAVGIIGKNGAGKSTLLKILSRITNPTTGSVKIKGRIASLLEVGTGFNPDLTGRENIFLNGAILGMTKQEIKAKFDEIVDFSGIEKFIDTPVKRYSSGMYVRLAFAVAAHLESEILILDEVLAVGDADFQKKCLGKMDDVAHKQGRTILFVSHTLPSVRKLCNAALLLSGGTVVKSGEVEGVLDEYQKQFPKVKEATQVAIHARTDRQGTNIVVIHSVQVLNRNNEFIDNIYTGQFVKFKINMAVNQLYVAKKHRLDIGLNNSTDERIAWFSTYIVDFDFDCSDTNYFSIFLIIKEFPLVAGKYSFTFNLRLDEIVSDWIKNAFSFTVDDGEFFGTGKEYPKGQGEIMIKHTFEKHVGKILI